MGYDLDRKIDEGNLNWLLYILTAIAFPFILLYLLVIKPISRGLLMFKDSFRVGIKTAYMKNFFPDKYRDMQWRKSNEDENLPPLLPAGKWKSFKDRANWPDAYAVDGVAIYAAEGRVLLYVDENVEEFDVPEGVTNIYHACFACCDKLRRVGLPASLKRLGKRAFYSCVSLKDVVLPESVEIVFEDCFMHCSSMESIVLPHQLTEIPARMFYNCRKLKEFVMPQSVTNVGKEAFKNCYSLERLVLNNQLKTAGENAFENCRCIKEFIMPETMEFVPVGLFDGCNSLERIHLSSLIKDFGGSCCRDCWNIKQITMSEDKTLLPYAKKHWDEYADQVDIATSENPFPTSRFWIMGDALYFGIPRLTSVCLLFCFSKDSEFTIPSFVTNVKYMAFSACKNLRVLRLSPDLLAGDHPWSRDVLSYDLIYDNWPQVEEVIFDETLKHTEYAYGLIS